MDYSIFRKVFWVGILSLIILWSAAQAAGAQDCIEEWGNEISVFIDGQPVKSEVAPILVHCYGKDGLDQGQYVLLPVRAVCEALGGVVKYVSETNRIEVTRGAVQISLTAASKIAAVNGKSTLMNVAPLNKNGKVMVPADSLCQMIGAALTYDHEKQYLYINTSSYPVSEEIKPENGKFSEQLPQVGDSEEMVPDEGQPSVEPEMPAQPPQQPQEAELNANNEVTDDAETNVKNIFTEIPSHMRVYIDGYALPAEIAVIPVLQFDDNRGYYAQYNMVSMENFMSALGATVSSNQDRSQLAIIKNNNRIDLTPYSETAYVNGLPVQLNIYPTLWQGSPMIAMEYACQALGADLNWDADHLQAFVVNDSNLVEEVLRRPSSWNIAPYILNNPLKYKLQILYTEIIRQPDGTVVFVPHRYRVDANDYFYPASSIKLAAVLAATDKANNVGANIWCNFKPAKYGGETLAQYISRILSYSDNSSFNMLYDFLGHKEFNQSLWAHGYNSVRVFHRLEVASNGLAAPAYQLKYNGKTVFSEPYRTSDLLLSNASMNGLLIDGTKFSKKNNISLEDLQNLLKEIFFPQTLQQGFNLTPSDQEFIKQEMLGSGSGRYKWFLCGGTGQMPPGIKIYNKIGNAYGFLVDNAYIVDNVGNEFFLTAVIYCDQAYYSVGMPFMRSLGYKFLDLTQERNAAHSSNR